MTARSDTALRRLFAAGPIAETDRYGDRFVIPLRRKGLVTSERALGNYWRWKHELTPAGIVERARLLEAIDG